MDHMKKLAIAFLAAVVAIAIAGVGSASAEQSVFCKANETPCASGNRYSSGTEVLLTSKGPIKWVSYGPEGEQLIVITCSSAEFKGEITKAGGSSETTEASFPTQILSSCGCGVTNLQQTKMTFNWTSGTMDASVTSQGPEYRFDCNSIFGTYQCTYGGEFKEGITLTGGNPAILAFKEAPVPKIVGNELPCGTTAKLSVEFEVEKPKPLYVSTA